jgi:hypothetical protein
MVILEDYQKTFNMNTFGGIVEGKTDYPIINSVLIGYFNKHDIDIAWVQPQNFRSQANYDKVFKSCKPAKLRQYLQINKYLIIHVDTDASADFGVPHQENGELLTPEKLVEKVVAKFRLEMGEDFYSQYSDRIIFAIAVHSIECWLFPLLDSDDKNSQTENCFQILKQTVANFRKNYEYYQEITKKYYNSDDFLKLYPKNPSLKIFIEELAKRNIEIPEES